MNTFTPTHPRALVVFLCALFLNFTHAVPTAHAASPEPATSTRAMVVSPHALATRAGLAMLRAGGNAVDAAVATAFVLGVAQPQSTGIGGGAFLLLHTADGGAFAIDARETAPAAAHAEMYLAENLPPRPSVHGGLAVGTPGFVAGLALALERHGTLPLARVLAPAIRAAREGVPLGGYQARRMRRVTRAFLARFPETQRVYFAQGLGARDVRRMPELARTLRALARRGPRAFYEGDIARAIVATARAHGGVLSMEDLANYKPRVREPLRGRYREFDVLSFPPPSSGGVTLLEILNVLDGFDLRALGAGSSASIHTISEAMKLAFADRALHLGDPDFHAVPTAALLAPEYTAKLRARIGERAAQVEGSGYAVPDGGTAHLSVVDAAGNVVALTSTINSSFGSFVTVPKWGILLNNEMDDFVADPDGENLFGLPGLRESANLVAPGKRPLSSMAPTIVLQDGRVRFVAGSSGGPRIITSVLLTLLNYFEWDMDVLEAVSAPRFHHQWRPDRLLIEGAHPRDVEEALRARGHTVERTDEIITGVEVIVRDPKTGELQGAPDPRRDGLAEGL